MVCLLICFTLGRVIDMKVFISDDQEQQRLWLNDIITAQLEALHFIMS